MITTVMQERLPRGRLGIIAVWHAQVHKRTSYANKLHVRACTYIGFIPERPQRHATHTHTPWDPEILTADAVQWAFRCRLVCNIAKEVLSVSVNRFAVQFRSSEAGGTSITNSCSTNSCLANVQMGICCTALSRSITNNGR